MKISAPKSTGVEPSSTPSQELQPEPEQSDELDFGSSNSEPQPEDEKPSSEKPFDDEPFDAGVEADEESDPKKYIEQLTGKLGQSLRKYNEEQPKPDFSLEKFAINSLLSATHTSEMDSEDQKDIINKVKTAGKNDNNQEDSTDDMSNDTVNDDNNNDNFGGDMGANQDNSGEDMENVNEEEETSLSTTHPWYKNNWDGGIPRHIGNVKQYLKPSTTVYNTKGEEKTIKAYNGDYLLVFTDGSEGYFLDWFPQKPMNENFMLPGKGKRMSIFAPEGSDEFMEVNRLDENNEQDLKVGDVVNYEGSKNKWKITNITEPNAIGQVRVFIAAIQADGSLGIKTETNPTKLTLVSNDEINEKKNSLWGNIEAKRKRGESPAKPGDEDYPDKKQWNRLTKEGENESNNYMFWQNLKNINEDAIEMLKMNQQEVDSLIADGHAWAVDHISTSKDDVEEVYHFLEANLDTNGYNDVMTENESNNYMYWSNLKTIAHATSELLKMDYNKIDAILSDGHGWALDHMATSADDIEEVYHFLANTLDAYNGENEGGYKDEHGSVENINMNESEYHGKKVKLGKPTRGDVKKYKVYVKNKKGNVIKVNFGDPNMEIKRDNPKRRKSFRARHKCAQAKDRTTPKYWSCKMWSSTPVSKIVGENLQLSKKSGIFDKNDLKLILKETFNKEDMNEPQVMPTPQVIPSPDKVQPNIAPSRKNKPFLPMRESQPDPKAVSEGKFDYETYHKTLAATLKEIEGYVVSRGYDPIEFDTFEVEHVAYGTTRRIQKELSIGGIPKKNKYLNAQIYRMDSGTYELNMYVG